MHEHAQLCLFSTQYLNLSLDLVGLRFICFCGESEAGVAAGAIGAGAGVSRDAAAEPREMKQADDGVSMDVRARERAKKSDDGAPRCPKGAPAFWVIETGCGSIQY